MIRSRSGPPVGALAALAAALTLGACASDGGGSTSAAGGSPAAASITVGPGGGATPAPGGSAVSTTSAPVTEPVVSPLPAVDVVDVRTGETVALAGLLPADQPTLVWMWAPH